MKRIHLNDDIDINIPDAWQAEQDVGLVSLYDPNGFGAIQVSYYSKLDAASIDVVQELDDHLSDIYEGRNIQLRNQSAYFETIDHDDVYWRYWLLRNYKTVLFVTYNCDRTDKGKEDEPVENIIRSIG